jgi:hypothetical protein
MSDTGDSPDKKTLASEERQARARARQAEATAATHAAAAAWKAQVFAHFSFLETVYGFQFDRMKISDPWETPVRYTSTVLAVEVTDSVEFGRVEVWLYRLVKGRVPRDARTDNNSVLLDNALTFWAPQEREAGKSVRGRDPDQLEKGLAFWARVLRTYGDDTLRGDLSIFEAEAERMRARRMKLQ